MKIKVVKLHQEGAPKVFGLQGIPERYHGHVQDLANAHADVLDRFLPVSLNEMAERVAFVASDIDAEVDASLLAEYAVMAEEAFASQGKVWYRLDDMVLP